MTDEERETKLAAERIMAKGREIEERWADHWLLDSVKVCRAYLEHLKTKYPEAE